MANKQNQDKSRPRTGGVSSYKVAALTLWKVNLRLRTPDGETRQVKKRGIPTREQAVALAAKIRAEAYEGRWFDRAKASKLTVRAIWEIYKPASERNDSGNSDRARAEHLLRHLGNRRATSLAVDVIDAYRTARLREKTQRKSAPSPAQLDREVELLKRMLSYAASAKKLKENPLSGVKLLKQSNVRNMVVDEEPFQKLLGAAEAALKPILVVAFDTGMRKREVLDLKWSRVDLKKGVVRLEPQDTKTEEGRKSIPLTARVRDVLKLTPRRIGVAWVFVSEVRKKGEPPKPWNNIGKMFRRAVAKAGLTGLWFHDLRRSFVTRARRRGIPESVVMRLSGHRTHSIFERYNIVEEDDLHAAIRQLEASNGGTSEGHLPV